ncbi:hypothetical protein THMIRHAS_16430 [Thiosulfatimonas sediminis]|uniref:Large ribosomal RNA subunit accumulation protein YceD n=1 Tax=Thiosulfatimonas sediminis TaxID=2675054 RepID=A0A6F8PWC2_9GAMM|nr:YceD family protein [Thiosulfatimonas sediminis]BBP46270.1 hypothetical protein THMIRHAS_16430 [Thiosulfatimonas sediminis]
MLNKLPDFIDPLYAVKHDKHYVGTVKLSRLKRLGELLTTDINDSREVTVDIKFYYNKVIRFPMFEMQLATELNLQCQRSLRNFECPIHTEVRGVFTETMALVDDLPEDIEVFELTQEKFSLHELVEEELLLCVPMVPVDPNSSLAYTNTYDNQQSETNDSQESQPVSRNPFAALQGLKK